MNDLLFFDKNIQISNKKKTSFLEIAELFLITTSTYFYQYSSSIPGLSLGDLGLLISLALVLYLKHGKTNYKLAFLFGSVLLVCFASSIISFCLCPPQFLVESSFVVFSRWIRFAVYCLIVIFVCFQQTKDHFFYKLYKTLSIVISVYAIIQLLLYKLTGFYLPANILPIAYSIDVSVESYLLNSYRGYGFFSEPSHLVKFLLPSLCFSLSGRFKNGKTDFLTFFLVLFAIFISSSLQGMVVAIITSFLYLIFSKKVTPVTKLSSVFIVCILAVVFFNSSIGQDISHRLLNISSNSADTSTYMRVFRGFDYYSNLPLGEKVFGIGLGNTANYAVQYGIKTAYDGYQIINSDILNYMSGITSLLVEGGIFALLIYFAFLAKLAKVVSFDGKILIVQLVLIQFSTSGFFSLFLIFYMFMITRYLRKGGIFNEKYRNNHFA